MDDSHGLVTPWFRRLKSWFGRDEDDRSSGDEPAWKRYGKAIQILLLVGTAFGGVIASVASTAIDRTAGVARRSSPVLAEFLWPILLGVTAIAVAVCLVVVFLSVRNL